MAALRAGTRHDDLRPHLLQPPGDQSQSGLCRAKPSASFDGILFGLRGLDVGLGQLAMDCGPDDRKTPLALVEIAGLTAVQPLLRPVRKRDAPCPG